MTLTGGEKQAGSFSLGVPGRKDRGTDQIHVKETQPAKNPGRKTAFRFSPGSEHPAPHTPGDQAALRSLEHLKRERLQHWWGKSSALAAPAIQIVKLFRPTKMADDIKLADGCSFGCGLGGLRGVKTCAQARFFCPPTIAGQEFLGHCVFDEYVHARYC